MTGPTTNTGDTGGAGTDRAGDTGDVGGAILVINAGSSSVKYELIEPASATTFASGVVERVGGHDPVLHHRRGGERFDIPLDTADHRRAIAAMVDAFSEHGPDLWSDAALRVAAVGHRVVMGGPDFHRPTVIDDELVDRIDELAPLAPLHNPANAAAIRMARELMPSVPHVAVFDTAFFHDLPPTTSRYAIDPTFAASHSIRRYGFHGISHEYVSSVASTIHAAQQRDATGPGGPASGHQSGPLRQIVMHLGNGASASAVVDGRPVDTSMGFTPLEGLVMGTRSGDIDPSVAFYLVRHHGMTIDEVDHLLNYESGMVAMAGSNDLRDVHERIASGDEAASVALEIYVHRLRRYIGAYAAVMGGLDVLTFTAGVGENDAVVRSMATSGLEFMGLRIDRARNEDPGGGHGPSGVISSDDSRVLMLVVPTREELSIAEQTRDCIAVI